MRAAVCRRRILHRAMRQLTVLPLLYISDFDSADDAVRMLTGGAEKSVSGVYY